SRYWLARRTGDGERRVFKLAMDGVAVSSMRREAAIFQLLRNTLGEHPNIVRMVGSNLDAAPYLLEFEYGGEDLPSWAAQDDRLNKMNLAERLHIFKQACEVIRALHSIDILFVDLKPSNILVAPAPSGWRVRLADFSCARILHSDRLRRGEIGPLDLT